MSETRAVVYGVGARGGMMARMMLDRGIRIVGAIGQNKEREGRDLGDVIGLGRKLGVPVRCDARAVLAEARADIAVVATTMYLLDHIEQLRTCIRAGTNVVTISEEAFYPWLIEPALSRELDDEAKAHGVTVTGTGNQDLLFLGLSHLASSAGHRVSGIRGSQVWDIARAGGEGLRILGVGRSRSEVEAELAGQAQRRPSPALPALHAIAARHNLTVTGATNEVVLVEPDEPVWCPSLNMSIGPGQVCGRTDRDRVFTAEGVELSFDMEGRILAPGTDSSVGWRIEGEPDIAISVRSSAGGMLTASQAVRRIPTVIAAEPGLRTVDMLPVPQFEVLRDR